MIVTSTLGLGGAGALEPEPGKQGKGKGAAINRLSPWRVTSPLYLDKLPRHLLISYCSLVSSASTLSRIIIIIMAGQHYDLYVHHRLPSQAQL
jgi:hypothetical protein